MRRSTLASLLALPCALALATTPLAPAAQAGACSCFRPLGPEMTPRWPWFQAEGYPANAVFTSSLEWHDASGRPLELARDEAASETFGLEVRRAAAMAEGDVFFPDDDCPATGECRHALRVGPADTTPPSAARLESHTVFFVDGAPASGGGCAADVLELEVSGTDDVTPAEELGIVGFVGATPEEVATAPTRSTLFTYDVGAPGRRLVSTIGLGGPGGTMRDEEPFRAAGPFCFAVALVDWAGNVGERSETVCLDATDRDDPNVELVPYSAPCSGPFCSARPGRSSSPLALAALAGLAVALTRRRIRR